MFLKLIRRPTFSAAISAGLSVVVMVSGLRTLYFLSLGRAVEHVLTQKLATFVRKLFVVAFSCCYCLTLCCASIVRRAMLRLTTAALMLSCRTVLVVLGLRTTPVLVLGAIPFGMASVLFTNATELMSLLTCGL